MGVFVLSQLDRAANRVERKRKIVVLPKMWSGYENREEK